MRGSADEKELIDSKRMLWELHRCCISPGASYVISGISSYITKLNTDILCCRLEVKIV